MKLFEGGVGKGCCSYQQVTENREGWLCRSRSKSSRRVVFLRVRWWRDILSMNWTFEWVGRRIGRCTHALSYHVPINIRVKAGGVYGMFVGKRRRQCTHASSNDDNTLHPACSQRRNISPYTRPSCENVGHRVRECRSLFVDLMKSRDSSIIT
jgi:hypothetical protein